MLYAIYKNLLLLPSFCFGPPFVAAPTKPHFSSVWVDIPMPVHVNWDDAEHTIIRVDYVGSWTWDECFEALRQANALSASVDHPVARIVDDTKGSAAPPNPLPQLPILIKLVDPRMDIHVSVGSNRFAHMMSDLFFRLGSPTVQRERYHWADSIEQARFMIRLYRERAGATGTGK
jgi:hypothetical protein